MKDLCILNYRTFDYSQRRRLRKTKCCGRDKILYDIWEWPRNDKQTFSMSVSLLVLTFCLLISSPFMFSTCSAYVPVIPHQTFISKHIIIRATSQPRNTIWRGFYCFAKVGNHNDEENKLHPPQMLPKEIHIGQAQSQNQNLLHGKEHEEPEIISMIRKLTNTSQIHDIVTLMQHQDTLNSTAVAEITQRFAYLLTYTESSMNGTSIVHQPFASGAKDNKEDVKLLNVILSMIKSIFKKTSFRHTQYQHVFDAANCFVGLTNVLQTFIITKDNHTEVIIPVMYQLWNRIVEYEQVVSKDNSRSIIYNMSPKRLVSFLLAMQKLRKYSSTRNDPDRQSSSATYNMDASSTVYTNACTRLCHGDRISRLNAHDICQTLKSIKKLSSSPWNVCNNPATQHLLICLVRRMRKPAIYNTTDATTIIQGLDQMHALWYSINATFLTNDTFVGNQTSDLSPLKVSRELKLSMYRLLYHVINILSLPNRVNQVGTTICKPQLSIKELGILSVAIRNLIPRKSVSKKNHGYQDNDNALVNPDSPHGSLVTQFQQILTMQTSLKQYATPSNTLQVPKSTTIRDISRILGTWEYYQSPNSGEDNDNIQLAQHLVQLLGRLTHQIVVEGTGNVHDVIMPTDINIIIRTLAFLPKFYSKQSYYIALGYLIGKNKDFLHRCSITELSNFCWFMAYKSNFYFYDSSDGDAVIVALGNRIIEPDICCFCSPKEACRILSAFTALCCDVTTARSCTIKNLGGVTSAAVRQQSHSTLLSNIFQCLGECLLDSSTLSSYDASSAIYAYAKAQYMFDMGIFDYLVEDFVKHVEINPSSCTLRQICQTLWACGKMLSFESSNNSMDNAAMHASVKVYPPYYNGFISMVSYVIRNADVLSVQDVTQTVWAISRFNLFAQDAVEIKFEPLLHQVQTLSCQFNAHERAILLWSFSRMPVMSPMLARIIFLLTRPFAQQSNSKQQLAIDHPQIASIILYSLGRMNIRDSDVFHYLTSYVLKHQIDTASAQTIANILWAHRTVHIEPPQQLLESWMILKLPDLKIVKGSGSNMWPYNEYFCY
jgi:hypothetical protein